MKLRCLVGASAGDIRDYSPIAARGALASGMAERIDERPVARRIAASVMDQPVSEKSKATPSRRKG